jgi:hypothetical protein
MMHRIHVDMLHALHCVVYHIKPAELEVIYASSACDEWLGPSIGVCHMTPA